MRRAEVFGKYQMLTRIASGGMAEVWLARSSSIGGFEKLLAIKRMHPALSKNQAFISMFIDEAKLTVQLSHPNIVQIFDFGRVDDDYFMAMEYIEGVDLATIAKRCRQRGTPLPVDMTAYIMRAVFDGLTYAHTRGLDREGRSSGVIHRDVSPQNVLVSFDGHVKVGDFGIAKAASEIEETVEGEVFGKLAYVSPEQCRGEAVDGLTDIWAAGVIAHELLSNDRLFARNNDYKTMDAVESMEILAPSLKNSAVPPELDALVLSTLQRNQDQRLPTSREGAEQLAILMGKHFPTASQYRLADVLRELWDGELPRLVPAPPPEPADSTRDHRPPSLERGHPVGSHTAAEIALSALRREKQVRQDSAWSIEATAAGQVADEVEQEPLPRHGSNTTELQIETTIPSQQIRAGREITRLKRRFMTEPNLWTLFDLAQAFDSIGDHARALGGYKLAAAKFAQRGLLIQAATIYRQVLETNEMDEQIREEIRRLPALQGMADKDVLDVLFEDEDDPADYSDYQGIFESNSETVDVISESPILSSLSAEQFQGLVPALKLARHRAGEVVVKEGDDGTSFYMLGRGRVVVSASNFEGQKIYMTSLSDGDCFGEHGFFTGEPRTATVESLGDVWVLEVSKDVLSRVIQEFPTVRESLRRFYKERIAESLLAKSQLFGHLSLKQRKGLAERFTFETYEAGDLVIREGDHSDACYAIKSGQVRVYAGGDEAPLDLAMLGPGDIFGEIAAIEGSRRTASVRATEECELLRLEAAELNAMLAKNVELRRMIEKKIEQRSEEKLRKLIDHT